jgi:hypothetical protein
MELLSFFVGILLFSGFFLFSSLSSSHSLIPHLTCDHIEYQFYLFWREKWYWTAITALWGHGSPSHFINNLLFSLPLIESLAIVMCLSDVFDCGSVLGQMWMFTFCFLLINVSGAMALLLSSLWNFYLYGEISQYNSTIGFSPAMYAIAFFLLTISPHTPIQFSLTFQSNDDILNPTSTNTFIIYFITLTTAFLPHFIQIFCESQPIHRNSTTHHHYLLFACYFLQILLLLNLYLTHSNPSNFPPLTSTTYVFLYLTKCFFFNLYREFTLRTANTTDHSSHVGGAVVGMMAGVVWCVWLWQSIEVVSVFVNAFVLVFVSYLSYFFQQKRE